MKRQKRKETIKGEKRGKLEVAKEMKRQRKKETIKRKEERKARSGERNEKAEKRQYHSIGHNLPHKEHHTNAQ